METFTRVLVAVVLAATLAVGGVGGPAGAATATSGPDAEATSGSGPAARATATERFVTRVYADFLGRAPSASDLAFWSGYVAQRGRTMMVRSVVRSPAFAPYWVIGINVSYLGSLDTVGWEPQRQLNDLRRTHDFLATEIAVLTGLAFANKTGGTPAGYVTGLYDVVLDRAPSASEQEYWTLRATVGPRESVARAFVRSREAARRRMGGAMPGAPCATTVLSPYEPEDGNVAGAYCLVLDRPASPAEAAYWGDRLLTVGQLPELWAALAGSLEYAAKA